MLLRTCLSGGRTRDDHSTIPVSLPKELRVVALTPPDGASARDTAAFVSVGDIVEA